MIIDTLELVKQHLMKHEEITLSRYEYTAIRKEIEESVKQSASPTNSAMDAIKAVCERTDPHETDVEVLRVAINKIYAALTMHHGANVV